ncbi:MAG: putative Ig domain-containing protein [Planctomycetes bacterium]|nr:putative Ig domain-containing protein [Planctomycetota bacterium]
MRCTTFLLLAVAILLGACTEEIATKGKVVYTWQFALLSPEELPDASVGLPYDVMLSYSVTGVDPYSWSLSAGSLPPGLSLTTTTGRECRLHGTPTQIGAYPFSIEIGSSVGALAFDRVIRVYPSGSLLVTTVALGPGMNGGNYGVNVGATGGSGAGYSWELESGTLPPGLNLDYRDDTINWGSFVTTGSVDQSLGNEQLSQVSGLVPSASQPGVFWMHDDTVLGPLLYAVNAGGDILQQYQLSTTRIDWEDIAIGPGSGFDYIYIGDFGDDAGSRADCRILRVSEPTVPPGPTGVQPLVPEEFWFTYPGGAQDCETLLFDRESGTPYLIERTPNTSPRVHKFPMPLDTAWDQQNPVTLIGVPATGTFAPTITGGDSSRDGRRVILRGYNSAREYARPSGADFEEIFNQAGTSIAAPGGQVYEAIAYGGDGTTLWTTTELGMFPDVPLHRADAPADNGFTTISGVPMAPGAWAFTLQVTDSAGNKAKRTFVIVIN